MPGSSGLPNRRIVRRFSDPRTQGIERRMNRTVRDIDDYLDGLPDDQRKALEKLRKQIRAAALAS